MKAPQTNGADTPRIHRLSMLFLVIGLVLFGLWLDRGFLPALIWAAILAVAVWPLYAWIEARRPGLKRGYLLPTSFTLAVALIVLAPIALAVAQAAASSGDIALWVADARAHGVPVPAWVHHLPFGGRELDSWWQSHLATPEATARELQQFDASTVMARSRLLGGALLHRSIIFLFTLIVLFFVLKDHEQITAQARIAGNRLLGTTGERLLEQLILSVRGTINGLVLVGIGEGLAMTPVYWFAGTPQPLLMGALTAIAAMIPFGAAVIFALASALSIGQGDVGWAVAIFAIGMLVVGIADHFLRPALIGGATRLPFIWVLIGIFGGVESLGLIGLFVGPATMAALIMLWRDLVADRPVTATSPE
ncbi:MAG TPA: AI-2E family transporter [Allosphingosinicella sp.]|nr:AI-2E family transporter [Allosphingosinicella sp.]